MQDLSHLLPGDPVSALVPSSESGGNQAVSNANAMTAPGGHPSTPFASVLGETTEHPPPAVEAIQHDRVTVTDDSGRRPA